MFVPSTAQETRQPELRGAQEGGGGRAHREECSKGHARSWSPACLSADRRLEVCNALGLGLLRCSILDIETEPNYPDQMGSIARHFLGWGGPAIERAADWLARTHGSDLSQHVIALPGARAGRLLLERLQELQPADWRPPRLVTSGHLTDEFLRLKRPSAARLIRTLSWEHALRGLGPGGVKALVARPPMEDEGGAWRALASEVRGIFAILSAEGLDFAAVSQGAMSGRPAGEQRRWKALAKAQEAAEAYLAQAGLCDPHRGRLEALQRGDFVEPDRTVVLVGVVDAIGLVRQLIEALASVGTNISALIFAPEDAAQDFDSLGCLVPKAWLRRSWAPDLRAWRIAHGPDDQAQQVSAALASFEGRYSAEQITVGVADREVAPFLERQLNQQGVFARDAEGVGMAATPPARLLAGASAFLSRGRFKDLAALVRHPDLEDHLGLDQASAAEVMDEYHNAHLPGRVPRTWLPAIDARGVSLSEAAQSVGEAVQDWLAPLGGRPRPLGEWAAALGDVLGAVYGSREIDRAREDHRLLHAGLQSLADGLGRLAQLPSGANPEVSASEALDILLSELGAERVPPRAPAMGEPSIELLGWLELAMDEAPALVLTGFNEGAIPEAVQGNGWLPNSLCVELGLPHDSSRLARDLYTLEWITHSREQTILVSGRRCLEGDPLRPPRLAFHGTEAETLERVRHFLTAASSPSPGATTPARASTPPIPAGLTEPEHWSASSLSAYLVSPYVFCLRYLAGLRTLDDRDQEMNPMVFGVVGHDVLSAFGTSGCAHSTDPEVISEFLSEELGRCVARRFGADPLPAVRLQIRQLAYRLEVFSRAQAARTAEGWLIQHVEWEQPSGAVLHVDDGDVALRGRIDRIDRHEDGRWAILDYKFGEKAKDPKKTRLRGGEWVDVQLPLYAHLASELIGGATPLLGYFNLAATESESGVKTATDFDETTIAEALDAARQVVNAVRAELARPEPQFELGRPVLYDPVLADLCGEGVLSLAGEEGEDE